MGYNKNGLNLNFDFVRAPGSNDVTINMTATNSGNSEITDFVFQAAVPKSFALSLQPPSGNQVAAFGLGSITQSMLIKNPTKVSKNYHQILIDLSGFLLHHPFGVYCA